MESEQGLQNSSTTVNTLQLECSETVSPNSVKREDLELIDIDSLFDEDTDDKNVLSEEEAWELFA